MAGPARSTPKGSSRDFLLCSQLGWELLFFLFFFFEKGMQRDATALWQHRPFLLELPPRRGKPGPWAIKKFSFSSLVLCLPPAPLDEPSPFSISPRQGWPGDPPAAQCFIS